MIKTWEDRMPARLPESMIDCAMMQCRCMADEITDLRAAIRSDDVLIEVAQEAEKRAFDELAALARVRYLESQMVILMRELRYIEGISTGQVNRVAKQALAQLRSNAEVSGLPDGPHC